MQYAFVTAATLATIFATTQAQIDPASVPLSTRTYWCQSQFTQCPLICTQVADGSAATEANTCDAATLNYACVCGNGLTPNASEYSQTIPYFICTETNNNCVKNCGLNNNACAAACTQNHPCGAQNPTRINATDAATTTTTSLIAGAVATDSDGGVVYNGFGGSSSTPSSDGTGHNAASRMLAGGETYGLAIMAGGVFAGFALLF